jgi:uncharacterized surface protein with fasciclin (FAS1) repeats
MTQRMRRLFSVLALAAALGACAETAPPEAKTQPAAPTAPAAATPSGPGAAMLPSRSVFDNIAKADDEETLEQAIRAAGMVNRLRNDGPFTLFAPSNAAFAALPPGALDKLLEKASKPALVKLLNYHLLDGALDLAALRDAVAAGGGRANLKTIDGAELTVLPLGGGDLLLVDAAGNQARILAAALPASNGVIYIIDGVLRP